MRPDISKELVTRVTEKWLLENGISADIPTAKILEDILLKYVEGTDTITRKVKDKLFRNYLRLRYKVKPVDTNPSIEINSTKFGYITVNNKVHEADVVLSFAGTIQEIKTEVRHLITRREFNFLYVDHPKIILIGTGQEGNLDISPEVAKIAKQRKVEIVKMKTTDAIKRFNQLYENGERVAAYMHVTC